MHREAKGCCEYAELSRRQFLGASSGAALFALSAPAWLPRVAYADDGCTGRDVIVSIYLRGGADGLTLCVPHGDADYYAARESRGLAIPQPGSGSDAAVDLDGFFGLPPAMAALLPAYQAGHLALVHACGLTDTTRSHFDAQRYMEVGKLADPTLFTGWLGRHLASIPPRTPNAALRAVAMGDNALPITLAGAPQALPVADPANVGLDGNPLTADQRRSYLADSYAGDTLESIATDTLATIDLLEAIDFAGYLPAGGAVYPETNFGQSLKATAALIKAQVGVEAAALNIGGWDTHENAGVLTGTLASLMNELAESLAAFHADLYTDISNVTVVAVSEFGRRVEANASNGTDHGHGNCMFVLGDNIAGGQVVRNWLGLHPDVLFEGRDVPITIDYRDILAEIVQQRLGNAQLDTVFPGYTPQFRNITRPC